MAQLDPGIDYPDSPPVQEMFPGERLDSVKASPLVRGMTPADLHDMEIAFTTLKPGENPKIKEITAQDLQTIENLFAEYRQAVIANYQGFSSLESGRIVHFANSVTAAASCCCCSCTPCCSCSAATEVNPFEA
jgi:hypothetical protein